VTLSSKYKLIDTTSEAKILLQKTYNITRH